MGTYKEKVQKEVYAPVEKVAEAAGKKANKAVASPGVEEAGSYTTKDVKKLLTEKKYRPSINKFINQ